MLLALGAGPLAASEPFPGALPAAFAVDAPLEAGVASRAVLDLYDGNVYVFRNSTWRAGGGETTHYDDIGLWKLVQADTGRQLVMRGGREAPIVFRIDGPDIVTPLDPAGEPWRVAGVTIRLHRTACARRHASGLTSLRRHHLLHRRRMSHHRRRRNSSPARSKPMRSRC